MIDLMTIGSTEHGMVYKHKMHHQVALIKSYVTTIVNLSNASAYMIFKI